MNHDLHMYLVNIYTRFVLDKISEKSVYKQLTIYHAMTNRHSRNVGVCMSYTCNISTTCIILQIVLAD